MSERKILSFACFCAGLIFNIMFSNSVAAESPLQSIIENVRLSEQLYRNIDVTWHKNYELINLRHTNKMLIKSAEDRANCVLQGDFYYLKLNGNEKSGGGAITNTNTLQSYDGTETRVLDQNAVGNRVDERQLDWRVLRPHTILLRHGFVGFPLSSLLSGDDAIKMEPNGRPFRSFFLSIAYEGEEKIDGLECARLRVDYFSDASHKDQSDKRLLWLARDRNYLLIKAEGFGYRQSKQVPIEEGKLYELAEIEPGIWFPKKAIHTGYDPIALQIDQKQEVAFRETYTVEKINLNPKYDVTFFQQAVNFPTGIPLYIVKAGRIVETIGVPPQATTLKPSSFSLLRILALLLNILAIIGLFLFIRVRRGSAAAL